MRIHYLQHVPFEGPGMIETWARAAGHHLGATHLYRGEPLPACEDIDWLVVMGGPMSVHDEAVYPWLRQEKRFIESVIAAHKTVLGICLGAQLIAETLGAEVYVNQFKEIGWFPVEATPAAVTTPIGQVMPGRFDAFHWHGETFGLPSGAIHLARSEACVHQAFVYGERVVGLQFHLETTRAGVEQLSTHSASDIVAGPFVQPVADMLDDEGRFGRSNELMVRLLDRLASLAMA